MEKEVRREIAIWSIIVIITLGITSVFSGNAQEPEVVQVNKELGEAYQSSYDFAIEARKLYEEEEYLLVQDKIDEGRVWIKKLKSLTEEESPESIAGNTWSVILDEVQLDLFALVEENIKSIEDFKGSKEEKKILVEESEALITTLENSEIEQTKEMGEQLREILNKKVKK